MKAHGFDEDFINRFREDFSISDVSLIWAGALDLVYAKIDEMDEMERHPSPTFGVSEVLDGGAEHCFPRGLMGSWTEHL